MDWVQIGSTFGIPVLLLTAIAYFTVRHVWPFVVKQLEVFQEERRQERKAWEEERKVNTMTLQQISVNLVAIAAAIQKINEGQGASTQAIQNIAQRIEAEAKRARERGSTR